MRGMTVALLISFLCLNSCNLLKKEKDVRMDFIGDQESYEYYSLYINKGRRHILQQATLESSLDSDSPAVLLFSELQNRSAYMLMLLEQGKDILCPFPLAANLGEYTSISGFRNSHNRLIGMINPLEFLPAVRVLADMVDRDEVRLDLIRINCNPVSPGGGLRVAWTDEGAMAGSAQAFLQMVTRITGEFPESLKAGTGPDGKPFRLDIGFRDFNCIVSFDHELPGWNIEISGEYAAGGEFSSITDHTGMLAFRNEVKPRIESDADAMEDAIRANLEDFMDAVKERRDPVVNNIDGLASIVLNNAVRESIETGLKVRL